MHELMHVLPILLSLSTRWLLFHRLCANFGVKFAIAGRTWTQKCRNWGIDVIFSNNIESVTAKYAKIEGETVRCSVDVLFDRLNFRGKLVILRYRRVTLCLKMKVARLAVFWPVVFGVGGLLIHYTHASNAHIYSPYSLICAVRYVSIRHYVFW